MRIVDNFIKNLKKIRNNGPSPQLTDAEVITMEIVGEFLGCGDGDKTIQRIGTRETAFY